MLGGLEHRPALCDSGQFTSSLGFSIFLSKTKELDDTSSSLTIGEVWTLQCLELVQGYELVPQEKNVYVFGINDQDVSSTICPTPKDFR